MERRRVAARSTFSCSSLNERTHRQHSRRVLRAMTWKLPAVGNFRRATIRWGFVAPRAHAHGHGYRTAAEGGARSRKHVQAPIAQARLPQYQLACEPKHSSWQVAAQHRNVPHATCNTPHATCNTPHATHHMKHAMQHATPSIRQTPMQHPRCGLRRVHTAAEAFRPCADAAATSRPAKHICSGTGLTPAMSGSGLGIPLPHLHRSWVVGLTPSTSAPGLGIIIVCVQLWVAHSLWLVSEFDYCMCTRKYSFSNKQVAML